MRGGAGEREDYSGRRYQRLAKERATGEAIGGGDEGDGREMGRVADWATWQPVNGLFK